MTHWAYDLDLLACFMGLISLTFLGAFAVSTATGLISGFRTDKVRALLAYLALEGARPQRRERLAALLWPENDHATALANLRLTLHRLRQTLNAAAPGLAATLLTITRSAVTFQIPVGQVDVLRFQQLLSECEAHTHDDLHRCDPCVAQLQEAVELYRGELLAGFSLADAPGFEEWLLLRRETLHHLGMLAIHHLAAAYETQGDLERALSCAQRKLALDLYREETHRQVMRLLARSGYTSQALAQYETCRRLLRNEVGVEPDAETIALAEQIRRGKIDKDSGRKGRPSPLTIDHSPFIIHQISPPLHNLPYSLPPLVGRAEQLQQLRNWVGEPTQRLVTIVGMGGMGKTRLALALMEQLVAETPEPFADGVWFVPLVGVAATAADLPGRLAGATLSAVGMTIPTSADLSRALLHYLAQRRLLLLFDNFEHLLFEEQTATAATQFLLALLQAAPQVAVLVTSRLPLQLLAETVLRLEGLPVPNAATSLPTTLERARYDSVGLFVYHARRTAPSFTLTTDNLPAVVELCHGLGGMPLAIELAAALTPHFTPTELAVALRQNLAILVSARRDLDSRHRQFSAVLESSWQVLSARKQQVLAQCSIFAGRFSREAAQAVTGATIGDLMTLVDSSLVQQTAAGVYQLHELLRHFASAQLQAMQQEGLVAERHSVFYLGFVATRAQRLGRHAPRQAVEEIQEELNNVRQAWAWAATHTATEHATPTAAVHLAASAYSFWQFYLITGRYAEGATAFRQAVEGVQAACQALEAAVASRARSERIGPEAAGDNEAVLLQWQTLSSVLLAFEADLLANHGSYSRAQTIGERAVALGVAYGSPEGEMLGLTVLAQTNYYQGQMGEAKRRAEQVSQRARQFSWSGEPPECMYDALATAYLYLSAIARNADEYAQAGTHLSQVLALCQPLGRARGIMQARLNLANLARYKQNYAAARKDYEQVLQIAAELGYRRGEAITLYELADVVRGQGEYSLALEQTALALTVAREIGEPFLENYAQSDLGRLYTYLGDYARANELVQQALTHHEHVALPDARHDAWLAAALYYHHIGDDKKALHYATRSHQHAQAHNNRRYTAIASIHMGYAWEGLRGWDAACQAYQTALQLYQALDIQPTLLEAQAGLARTQLAQGDQTAAIGWIDDILSALATHLSVGMDEPFLIYLTCYQVLAANHDTRATTLLQRGYDLLQQYADRIQDDALRRSFLENVPVHRALQEAHAQRSAPA
ncbi:MAG: tetratricopeptide repeat protein [Caldilineaceae bacterium]|nr:tetratricopeptide repeat protein [Caldilineaceae bacterium]